MRVGAARDLGTKLLRRGSRDAPVRAAGTGGLSRQRALRCAAASVAKKGRVLLCDPTIDDPNVRSGIGVWTSDELSVRNPYPCRQWLPLTDTLRSSSPPEPRSTTSSTPGALPALSRSKANTATRAASDTSSTTIRTTFQKSDAADWTGGEVETSYPAASNALEACPSHVAPLIQLKP
jgi:hypothetical protein